MKKIFSVTVFAASALIGQIAFGQPAQDWADVRTDIKTTDVTRKYVVAVEDQGNVVIFTPSELIGNSQPYKPWAFTRVGVWNGSGITKTIPCSGFENNEIAPGQTMLITGAIVVKDGQEIDSLACVAMPTQPILTRSVAQMRNTINNSTQTP